MHTRLTDLRQITLALIVASSVGTASAQQGAADIGARLLQAPPVAAAVRLADSLEPWVLEQQVALCEVPAPPFAEGARAEAYRKAFQALGLADDVADRVDAHLGEAESLGGLPVGLRARPFGERGRRHFA
ncbi:MAG: hypothetical protein ACO1TH_12495, partial [Luteitalea sp.]